MCFTMETFIWVNTPMAKQKAMASISGVMGIRIRVFLKVV